MLELLHQEFDLVGGPLDKQTYVCSRETLCLHFPVDKEGNVALEDGKLVKVETAKRFLIYENKGGKMVYKED